MALPSYGQDAIARRYGQPNQFTMPQGPGGPSPAPNFTQIGAGTLPTQQSPFVPIGPGQFGNPNRDRLYNENYSGPMFNPYAEVGQQQNDNPYPTPYPGVQVSPTGAITGAQPIYARGGVQAGESTNARNPSGGAGPTTSRQEEQRNRPKGALNPRNDPHMSQMKGGPFIQGGRDWKGYSKKEKKFLGRDATLDEALRQLIASQGDFAQQYNKKTGNIADVFRRAHQDIQRNRGVAETDLENAMASSGLTRSSGALTEQGNLAADFDRQLFDARMGRTTGLSEALAERQNFMRQLEIARTQAREEALRRYATKQFEIGGLIG